MRNLLFALLRHAPSVGAADELVAPVAFLGAGTLVVWLVAAGRARRARRRELAARSPSGARAPERVTLPIEEVVADALTGLREPLGGRPVSVFIRPDVPMVRVDPLQIGRVFRTVLANAARFAPEGTEIRIAASAWRGAVEVRVSDRGPVAAAGEREAIFEASPRAGDARGAGAGPGLAGAKAIIHAHGGSIWIEETPGGGATVVVRLPATAED